MHNSHWCVTRERLLAELTGSILITGKSLLQWPRSSSLSSLIFYVPILSQMTQRPRKRTRYVLLLRLCMPGRRRWHKPGAERGPFSFRASNARPYRQATLSLPANSHWRDFPQSTYRRRGHAALVIPDDPPTHYCLDLRGRDRDTLSGTGLRASGPLLVRVWDGALSPPALSSHAHSTRR